MAEDTEEKESRENLERLEKEILYELNSPDYYGLEEPPKRGAVEGEENA